ncbi:expressed unknown protein [Seminavis robusta]|uniref:TLC domain-containing protein n=1 Tax=Seminavis robusta TaxID=568900 RepID=A0A9N8HSN5_9STRA|nr:expressed unknown protein [Seminavis robusta]|eukprot:Sro1408_g270070.1 n/a (347) ;mRNA; f:9222-10262
MTDFPSCIPSNCPHLPEGLMPEGYHSIPLCEEESFDQAIAAGQLPPPGTWSWEWFKFAIPDSKYQDYVTGTTSASVFLALIVVALSYPVFNMFWTKRSETFRGLSNDQQVVVIQHTIEAFYLTLAFPVLTWAMLSANFQVPFSADYLSIVSNIIGGYMVWIVHVYVMEIVGRYRTIRPLVLVHHLCAAGDALLPLYVMSAINIRCAAVLTYFIAWEAPVFIGLFMYRLYPLNKWTPRIIRFSMWTFGLSRPVQMAWILALVIVHWENSVAWHAITQVCFGVLFSSLQLYTLVIHNALLKKCLKMQRGSTGTSVVKELSQEVPDDASKSTSGGSAQLPPDEGDYVDC